MIQLQMALSLDTATETIGISNKIGLLFKKDLGETGTTQNALKTTMSMVVKLDLKETRVKGMIVP